MTYDVVWALRPRKPPQCSADFHDRLQELGLWSPCRLRLCRWPSSCTPSCGCPYPSSRLAGMRLVLRRGRRAGRRLLECKQSTRPSTSRALPTSLSSSSTQSLKFGVHNIRSLTNKLDDLLDVRRERSIDVLCLVETWHDDDCVGFSRLRTSGFCVVDRPRPRRLPADDLSTNHGGVAVVAVPGVNLAPVTAVTDATTMFEFVCVRVTTGQFAAIVVVIYRPGSSVASSVFFDELSSVFDAVAAFKEPVIIAGDFNVWLDCVDDARTRRFNEVVADHGLVVQPTGPTHSDGHTLDAVVTRADVCCTGQSAVHVSIVDTGLSDHRLLTWSMPAHREPPLEEVVARRCWRKLDVDRLREELRGSVLCSPDGWPTDIDAMAALYDTEINAALDKFAPIRQFVRRPRPSDPWFDHDCRSAKRRTRRLERACSSACRRSADNDPAAIAAKEAWYAERRTYRQLLEEKRRSFWCATIEADRASPRQLWRSVDLLLGRGRPPPSSAISADNFSSFFIDKVTAVRSGTKDAPEPSFTKSRSEMTLSAFTMVGVSDMISACRS